MDGIEWCEITSTSTYDKWPPSVITIATAATTNTTIIITAITVIRLVGTDQTND